MAKLVKVRRKKRFMFGNFVALIFFVAMTFMFVTAIFGRSENQRLSREIENTQIRIADITAENQDLARQVNELSSYSRVVDIAIEGGLEFNHDNRLYVRGN